MNLYCPNSRTCIHDVRTCDGCMDESGHCDEYTTQRDLDQERRRKVRDAVSNVAATIAFIAALAALYAACVALGAGSEPCTDYLHSMSI